MPSWTFTSSKGESVSTSKPRTEILSRFGELARSDDWLWFHIVKMVEEADKPSTWGLREAMEFLADSFLLALGMPDAKGGHLKKPMIRCHYGERRFKFYLSGRGTLCLKSGAIDPGTKDPVGEEEYIGCIFQGKFLPGKEGYSGRLRPILPPEQAFLDALCSDPATFLAKCASDMGRCVYCNAPLNDERSLRAKCGEVCAIRWGVPWTDKEYQQKVPSFAELWSGARPDHKQDIRALCKAIRVSPYDPMPWAMLGDALEEAGYTRRPEAPARGTVIPVA